MPYGCAIYFVVGTGVLDCPLVTDYGMLDSLCHLCGIIANFLNGSHRCLVNEDGKFARLLASLVRALTTVGRAKIKIAPDWVSKITVGSTQFVASQQTNEFS